MVHKGGPPTKEGEKQRAWGRKRPLCDNLRRVKLGGGEKKCPPTILRSCGVLKKTRGVFPPAGGGGADRMFGREDGG